MTNTNEADEEWVFRRDLGQRIVEIRHRRGLSQVELARRLGVAKSRLNHWEKGCHLPPLEHAVEIATALQVGLDELVLGKSPAGAQPGMLGLTPKQFDRLVTCLRNAMGVLRNEEQRERRTHGSISPRRSR